MTGIIPTFTTKSDYFKKLNTDDQQVYTKKLTLSSGVLLPDPYAIIGNQWSSDVTLLPDISFPDISFYLIETSNEFTRDKMRAYKSLDAYNFFIAGHVQDVFIHKIKSTYFVCLKTKVLPSQRQGDGQSLYEVRIIFHKTGWILSANCTCMAG